MFFTSQQAYEAHGKLLEVMHKQNFHPTTNDFYAWLFPPTWIEGSRPYDAFYRMIDVDEGTEACRKMQILLSPHWYALIKAYLIKHPWDVK